MLESSALQFIIGLDISTIQSIVSLLVCVLLGLLFLCYKQSAVSFVFKSVIILSVIFIGVISKNYLIITVVFFVVNAQFIDFDEIVFHHALMTFLTGFCIVLLAKIGFIPTVYSYRDGILRNALGFGHPNTAGRFMFVVALDLCVLLRKKNYIVDKILISMIAAFLIYQTTNSRTSTLSILLFPIMLIVFNHGKHLKNNIFFRSLFIAMPALLAAGSIFFVNNFKYTDFYVRLDDLLSQRLSMMHLVLQAYSPKMVSLNGAITQDLVNRGVNVTEDNVFITILVNIGVLFLLLFVGYLTILVVKFIGKSEWILLFAILTQLIFGLSESGAFSIANNVLLLGVSYIQNTSKKLRG